ncbi:hypothetical protein C0989_011669 [Termitomyces sp. Mn162]|nr:hypothetical protein C0989_011669 [Termitomyces sp. Mn162]
MSYTLSATTYFKIFFHAAKHPHKQINGVLLGKKSAGDVIIEDAVPLLHHWTSLSPMMEIGLDLVYDLPRRAVALVRDEHRHHKFGDFDDHLEDVSIANKPRHAIDLLLYTDISIGSGHQE